MIKVLKFLRNTPMSFHSCTLVKSLCEEGTISFPASVDFNKFDSAQFLEKITDYLSYSGPCPGRLIILITW